MNAPLDLYCERCGPGFWAEPLNAVSNVAFLLAAAAAWWSAKRRGARSRGICTLIGLAATVGVGSFLFHTFATLLTMYLDVIPILVFQLFFLWVYARRQMGWNLSATLALLLGLLAVSVAGLEWRGVLNGSLAYAPAWLLLAALGGYHVSHAQRKPWQLLIAAILLFLALVFRTIDLAVCETIPFGTHFLWHLINGFVFFLVIQSVILNTPQPGSAATASGE